MKVRFSRFIITHEYELSDEEINDKKETILRIRRKIQLKQQKILQKRFNKLLKRRRYTI